MSNFLIGRDNMKDLLIALVRQKRLMDFNLILGEKQTFQVGALTLKILT